ncbi:queuosine precursor transporter [Candidatus Saccharibacteria bacterium]|nr:queuosine precursor transporter [Candidatus Saccharibacteria bacterium]
MFKIQKFDLVVALFIFGVMTAEIFGSKTFPLTNFSWMHLNASVAIFVLPLLFTLTDVVVEVHGRARARSMVWSGLIVIALLLLFSLLATHLPPSKRFAASESAYDKIFGLTARISAASLAAFAISEFLDVAIFAKLREKLHKKALWLRNNLSNFISMFVDSLVFIFLAFYSFSHGLGDNLTFLFGLIIPYWLIKCSLSVLETPLVYLGVRWLKEDKAKNVSKTT